MFEPPTPEAIRAIVGDVPNSGRLFIVDSNGRRMVENINAQ